MRNNNDRKNFSDALIKETYGLKHNESAFFIGALISNLSHNLPAEMADRVIDAFKESRETVKDIIFNYNSSLND